MVRAAADWVDTDGTLWEEDDLITAANILSLLKMLEWLAQNHGHAGAVGGESKLKDGATLVAGDYKTIWLYGPALN